MKCDKPIKDSWVPFVDDMNEKGKNTENLK